MVLFPLSSATTLSGLSTMWRGFSQGSSFLATLGFVAESLWDSALGATHSRMRVRSHATDETLRCMSIGAHAAWGLFFQVVPIGAEFGVTLLEPLGGSQLQQLFEIAHEVFFQHGGGGFHVVVGASQCFRDQIIHQLQ